MQWQQTYTPLGSLWLSAIIAALPVILLLALLAFFHVRAHFAALCSLAAALLIAITIYRMPVKLAAASAAYGAVYGLFPIGWIVLCAIFVYEITVHTGTFEIVKRSIAALGDDRRIQVLLIAFSFGAFIEGAAGFGTPVAISAAMLIGLGFKPLHAAGLALIGNTAPVAFGALGTPILALAGVTGIPARELSGMVGRQLPWFSMLVPFWLIAAMCGWRGMVQVWPACITCGSSFALVQYLVSNFHGPSLVDVLASLTSIASLLLLLQVWRPRQVWRFPEDEAAESGRVRQAPGLRESARAWAPWIILSIFVFVWGLPLMRDFAEKPGVTLLTFKVPFLHETIARVPPVVPKARLEQAVFKLNWASATGTALLLAGLVSGFLLGMSPRQILSTFARTCQKVTLSLLTIAAMLALGFTTRYGGLDATMGLAFASTGFLFPFFSPLLGWLGVALTGSDTSSNVLFGNLQQITALQLGLSPVLMCAANSSGGVMGKMIDAQSIVVAAVATQQHGQEGRILRYVFFHSLVLACLVGIMVMLQARVFAH